MSRLRRLQALASFAFAHPRMAVRGLKSILDAKRRYPDVHALPLYREFRESLPQSVLPWFDDGMKRDHRFPVKPSEPRLQKMCHETDVLYLGTFKPDANKDLLALRQYRPDIRITGLVLSGLFSTAKASAYEICDEVFFFQTHAHLIEFLLSTKAKTLIFQGGEDQLGLTIACMWPGRLVWQARDTFLRTPRFALKDLPYERSKFIAERADAITSFHSEEGWRNLAPTIAFRSPPSCIPPLCVPVIGPHKRLPKHSATDGETHLIYAGGVGPVGSGILQTSDDPHEKFRQTHADFYNKFRLIVEQGIHLHVYSSHLAKRSNTYEEYFLLQETSRYFHIESPVSFETLLEELTRYDWAIMHVTWQNDLLVPGFDRPVQNGLTGPIQAGVPIIVSPTAKGNVELVTRYRRGVVVEEGEMPKLSEILAKNAGMVEDCVRRPLEPELLYDVERFGKIVLPA